MNHEPTTDELTAAIKECSQVLIGVTKAGLTAANKIRDARWHAELKVVLQREAATQARHDARIAELEAKLETVTAARDALLDDKRIVKDLYDLVVIQRDAFLVRAEKAESRVAVLEAMVAKRDAEA